MCQCLIMDQWRADLHEIPELAFEEFKTAAYIAALLKSFGLETHEKIGGTGIVAKLQRGTTDEAGLAIRADMDALQNGSECAHLCGHDGHMAIVLGVARHFSNQPEFRGTLYFIFSPAEEDGGGCQKMLEDPRWTFDITAIYGLHNWPELDVGTIGVSNGIMMAGDFSFTIHIKGKSGHGAMPQFAINPIDYITHVNGILYDIANQCNAIITPTMICGGESYNVIPEVVSISGTCRFRSQDVSSDIIRRLEYMNDQIPDVNIDIHIVAGYPPTINDAKCAQIARRAVKAPIKLVEVSEPSMATEDFSFFLQKYPGCYVWLGAKDQRHDASLHNAHFEFNDALLQIGLDYFKGVVEMHN